MPLYEARQFAENRITVNPAWRDALVIGSAAVVAQLAPFTTRTRKEPRP